MADINYGDLIPGNSTPIKGNTPPKHIDGTQTHLTAIDGTPNYTPFISGTTDEMASEIVINNQIGIQTPSTRVYSPLIAPLLDASSTYYLTLTVRELAIVGLNQLGAQRFTLHDATVKQNFPFANGTYTVTIPAFTSAIIPGTPFVVSGQTLRFDIPPITLNPLTARAVITRLNIQPAFWQFTLSPSVDPWTLDSGSYPDTIPTHHTFPSQFNTPLGSPVAVSALSGTIFTHNYGGGSYSYIINTQGPGSWQATALFSMTVTMTFTITPGALPGP